MYLIVDPPDMHVFTEHDPRNDGFTGDVQEGVTLAEEFPEIQEWPGGERPEQWLGVSDQDRSRYGVFPSTQDCVSAGFTPLTNQYWIGETWDEWSQAQDSARRLGSR